MRRFVDSTNTSNPTRRPGAEPIGIRGRPSSSSAGRNRPNTTEHRLSDVSGLPDGSHRFDPGVLVRTELEIPRGPNHRSSFPLA